VPEAEQVFIATEAEEETEQKGKKTPRRPDQAVDFLDETQQRAAAAYIAYIEAERQLEEAYKDQEGLAEKAYSEAVEHARRTCEETIAQGGKLCEETIGQARQAYEETVARALKTREEAERKARQVHNQTLERTWTVFTKARK
jgi:hypothetical protein